MGFSGPSVRGGPKTAMKGGAHPFRPLDTSLGLAAYARVRWKLGSAREYTCLSTNGVGEHSLIRLCPPAPLVGAPGHGRLPVSGGLDGTVGMRRCLMQSTDLSLQLGELFLLQRPYFFHEAKPIRGLSAPLIFF